MKKKFQNITVLQLQFLLKAVRSISKELFYGLPVMKVLVFWISARSSSILDEEELCPNKKEGETTSARYGNKLYKAKILKKSCKFMDLCPLIFENI